MNKELSEIGLDLLQDFNNNYSLANLQIESYNFLITHTLPKLFASYRQKFYISKSQYFIIEFYNVMIEPPYIYDEHRNKKMLFPHESRICDLTYESTIYVDILTELIDINTNMVLNSQLYSKVYLMNIPVMVRSCLCSLMSSSDINNECEYDKGGYFIIKGKERVLIPQERINYNQVHIFSTKGGKYSIVSEIRSIKEDAEYSVLFQLKFCDNYNVYCSLPYIEQDIPLGIVIIALNHSIKDFISKLGTNNHSIFNTSLLLYQNMTQDDAIKYIAQFTKQKMEDSPNGPKQMAYTENLIFYESLPHLGYTSSREDQIWFIIYMLEQLFDYVNGNRQESDRDNSNNKRCEMSGHLIGNLIKLLFRKSMKTIQQNIEKKKQTNITTLFSKIKITSNLYRCFTTSNWGVPKSNYIRQGVSQVLDRKNLLGYYSHLRRLVIPIGKESKNIQIRQLHPSTIGFLDCTESPEGANIGIVKNFALLTRVSEDIEPTYIQDIIEKQLYEYLVDKNIINCKLILNGCWIYCINNKSEFITQFRRYRMIGLIPFSVSISYEHNIVTILTDAGRMLRAVYKNQPGLVENLKKLRQDKHFWKQCEDQHLIEFLDPAEIESSWIGMTLEDEKIVEKDFFEIHPSAMFGAVSSLIPFANNSQGPRNIYNCAQMKQAMGFYTSNINERFDTSGLMLHYPQKSLNPTKMTKVYKLDEIPYTTTAVVAIMCYSGQNQEDSIIINRSAIDRGMFRSTTFKTVSASEIKNGQHSESIEIPPIELQQHSYNYSLLQQDGIIATGTQIREFDVLVGIVTHKQHNPIKDCSLVCKNGEEGIVDKICITYNKDGYKHVKIRISKLKIPEIGDKFAMSAQKSTVGMLYSQEDMPFTKDGIVPDLIMNTHAIPSRMTIAYLLELLCGKANAYTGEEQDSTPFCHNGEELVEKMSQILKYIGFEPHGNETLYNGFTGQPFKSKIFMGIGNYQRLKHLVSEKVHSRSRGNVNNLVRQPNSGRRLDGGLRVGEMERDTLIAHGTSLFLKERLFDMSDAYEMYVCPNCGAMTHSTKECNMCNTDSTEKAFIPYACKLLFQELQAMGIKICVDTK